ncbi:MAG: WYL domain-containing protein [bacterium]
MTTKIKVLINNKTNIVLTDDMKEFGNEKPSGGINANEFLCNVAIRMYKKRIKEEAYYTNEFLNLFKNIEVANIIASKAIALKTNLDENTLDFLPSLNQTYILYTNKSNSNDINEIEINGAGKNNTSLSAYFRSLFNEYASKTKIEREKIYFSDLIEKIRNLEHTYKTCFIKYDNKKYYLAIESPAADFGDYNLYSCAINLETQLPIAFKLSKIKDIITVDEYYHTSTDEWDSMGDRWCCGDIDSVDDLLDIQFKLTKNGEKRFESHFHKNKYNIDRRIEDEVSYCKTTENFFFNYFISYGCDIKIISPESVRKRFIDFYENSYKNFDK